MIKLYYLPGACSLASQVLLRELDEAVELINRDQVEDYSAINPVGAVPVLVDGETTVREGAAIMLYLLEKHRSPMLPERGPQRIKAIEDILFANATMHPAYGLLFFFNNNLVEGPARDQAMAEAAKKINRLWRIVEDKLADAPFLGGATISAADLLLAVFSSWGAYFPVEIKWGPRVDAMLEAVKSRPAFRAAIAAEKANQSQLTTA